MPDGSYAMHTMSPLQDVQDKATNTRTIDVLADDTRRRILRLLRRRTGPATESALAAELAETSEADEDVSAATERFQLRLRHVHLPKLAERDLVTWDRSERTVTETGRPHGGTDLLEAVVSDERRTAIASALSDGKRRAIVELVSSAPGPVERTELAEKLTTRAGERDGCRADANDVAVQLHHRHLPALEAAGLVEYDTAAETVTYAGPGDGSALLASI